MIDLIFFVSFYFIHILVMISNMLQQLILNVFVFSVILFGHSFVDIHLSDRQIKQGDSLFMTVTAKKKVSQVTVTFNKKSFLLFEHSQRVGRAGFIGFSRALFFSGIFIFRNRDLLSY